MYTIEKRYSKKKIIIGITSFNDVFDESETYFYYFYSKIHTLYTGYPVSQSNRYNRERDEQNVQDKTVFRENIEMLCLFPTSSLLSL